MGTNGRVQIRDYSDREILMMMLDIGGKGWITTLSLATRIYGWKPEEITPENEAIDHGSRCVTSRLAWMKRVGLVEKGDDPGNWSISSAGQSMVGFELSRPIETALMRVSDTGGLALANRVGEKLVKAGEITGTAMRRELQFQITRRKRR
jgi:hypothetical protein